MALYLKPHVEGRIALLCPVIGLAVAGLAIAFAEGSGKSSSVVLFSGQSALPRLLENSATYSVGALVLLVACKGLAYGLSLSAPVAVAQSFLACSSVPPVALRCRTYRDFPCWPVRP